MLLAALAFAHCAAPDSHHHDLLDVPRSSAVTAAAGQVMECQKTCADDDDACCHSTATSIQARPVAGPGLPTDLLASAVIAGPVPAATASGRESRAASADPPAGERALLMVWRL
jgi:hypothetical protein